MTPAPTLNPDQQAFITKARAWLADPSQPFFVLKGWAGTGKTFAVSELAKVIKGRLVFTAPTNKATKVLREVLTTPQYRPDCRTIYSLLGLRLEASGEVRELAVPEEPLDLSLFAAVVVDEASMLNRQVLTHIRQAADTQHVKFLFMGDPAQLPPVKELNSPVWDLVDESGPSYAELSKVMRHDNTILDLATRIRAVVNHPAPSIRLESANDGEEGVWKLAPPAFYAAIRKDAASGAFSGPGEAKAIAWRNVTVDRLNAMIRGEIFDEVSEPWLPTDRVIFTGPAKDLTDEPMASTDDEGRVESVAVQYHPLAADFKVYTVTVCLDDNRMVTAQVLHPQSLQQYEREVAALAERARKNGKLWKAFWEFKELFHGLRHAYAITAHRSQGSTYQRVYVDYRDVLLNQNRQEAYRCLYVACTRPRKELFLA